MFCTSTSITFRFIAIRKPFYRINKQVLFISMLLFVIMDIVFYSYFLLQVPLHWYRYQQLLWPMLGENKLQSSPPQYCPSQYRRPPNTAAHFQVPNKGFVGWVIYDSQYRRFWNIAAFSPLPRSAVLGGLTVYTFLHASR